MLENVKMWTEGVAVEYDALTQIANIAGLPIIASHVAIMPDVHLGKGATVGSVIPTRNAIIPAAVGVDIGCGMCAVRLNLKDKDLPNNLKKVREEIEKAVPVGFDFHKEEVKMFHDGLTGIKLHNQVKQLREDFAKLEIMDKIGRLDVPRVWGQVGTLGGGNHFIELCLDENKDVWLMLHSGSRNVGKTIGETAINMAKEIAEKIDRKLPDKALAWLDDGTPEFDMYMQGLLWAQRYAALNREVMMHLTLKAVQTHFKPSLETTAELVNCHHNYAQIETLPTGENVWITRKGAVSARQGEMGIIPGSMGAKSFIVSGKGNVDSHCSCSHGAGRRHSRGEAKRRFTLEDLEKQTNGVECRKDRGVLDEIPSAYKDIDKVMEAQKDLVDIVHTLRQVVCIKG